MAFFDKITSEKTGAVILFVIIEKRGSPTEPRFLFWFLWITNF